MLFCRKESGARYAYMADVQPVLRSASTCWLLGHLMSLRTMSRGAMSVKAACFKLALAGDSLRRPEA
jgi:hypothetical protein